MNTLIGISLGVAVAVMLVVGWVNLQTQRRCLAAGYPAYRVTPLFLERYCVKRVDQTDVVIPAP